MAHLIYLQKYCQRNCLFPTNGLSLFNLILSPTAKPIVPSSSLSIVPSIVVKQLRQSSSSFIINNNSLLKTSSNNNNSNITNNFNRNNYLLTQSTIFNFSFDQQVRFKNRYHGFSDGTAKPSSLFAKFFYALLLTGFTVSVFTNFWFWLADKTRSVDAASPTTANNNKDGVNGCDGKGGSGKSGSGKGVKAGSGSTTTDCSSTAEDESGKQQQADDKPRKKRMGFRERKIIEYENRIRDYSTPDKIFRYFATKKVTGERSQEVEICMTPDDFVRSITPSAKQIEGLGLDRFEKFDPKSNNLSRQLGDDSIFWKFSEKGLISFSDYMFLLVVLSTPPRVFEIAFKMFDTNGDGNLDFEEFQTVTEVMRSHSSMGMRHRDHAVTGNTLKSMSGGLTRYFFGSDLAKKLTVEKFLKFQLQIMTEILKLEFHRYESVNGVMSERDFADSLIAYTGHNASKRAKMLKRVKKAFVGGEGITFKEYLDFFQVLKYINDVDVALVFYHVAGASIDKETLKHVANTVAHVRLSQHLVDVVFVLFDEDDDGELSNREFVSVMKRRMMRGLEKPKDTGFIKILDAIWKCSKLQIPLAEA